MSDPALDQLVIAAKALRNGTGSVDDVSAALSAIADAPPDAEPDAEPAAEPAPKPTARRTRAKGAK